MKKKFEIILGIEKVFHNIIEYLLTSFKFNCINCTKFFLIQFSEGFFSFVLEKFGLEDMSPSLDCKGYLNGLVFNFKIIRISQRANSY